MGIEWKDETIYSRGDKERTPSIYRAHAGKVIITIHKWHGLGDDFFLKCPILNIEMFTLGTSNPEHAKQRALSEVAKRIKISVDSFNTALSIIESDVREALQHGCNS